MAFHEVERGTWQQRESLSNTVKVHSSTANKSSLTFTISSDIMGRLGDPVFLNMMIGSGEHSGFIALIPRNTRGTTSYKVVRKGKKFAGRFGISGAKIGIPYRPVPPTKLPYEITSDGVIVDLRSIRSTVQLAAAE